MRFKIMRSKRLSLIYALLLATLTLWGCGQSPEDELSGTWYVQARFGKWVPLDVTETRTFDTDGTLTIHREQADAGADLDAAVGLEPAEPFVDHTVSWSIVGQWRMRIDPGEKSDAPAKDVLYRIEGDTLTLADDTGETILTRDKGPSAARQAAWDAVERAGEEASASE